MLLPLIPLMVNVVPLTFFEMLPLLMLQLPLVPVVQPTDVPPAVNVPLAVAPACKLPAMSLTVTMTVAFQLLREAVVLPVNPATATETAGTTVGGVVSLLSSAYSKMLPEP